MKTAVLTLALLSLSGGTGAVESWPQTFVHVEQVPADLITPDGARITVLDAHQPRLYRSGHIPGAQNAVWTRYRAGWFRSGRLPDDLRKLARQLGKLGVDEEKPVLVCGNADEGWGEEGRIGWMIRYLGHPAVAILDGGCDAWRHAGRHFTTETPAPTAGNFTPRPRNQLRARTQEVAAALSDDTIGILDVRTQREFNAATPYFASRGGHIPTAVNIPIQSFCGREGRVKETLAMEILLQGTGLPEEERLIVNCTGGVRSAFVAELVREIGVEAANYDASFWAWSADHTLPVARPDH